MPGSCRTSASNCSHDRFAARERRPHRHADADFELALVVGRQKVLAQPQEQGHGRERHQQRQADDRPAVRHRPVQHLPVRAGEHAEQKRVLGRAAVAAADLEEPRAEHRREREADQQGNQDGERRRVAETRHEPAHDAGHHGHREEDDHQAEGGGHDRQADLAGAFDGRLHGRQLLLLGVAEDVLQHHDGVVDHDAYHQHQRQHGDLVEREAHPGSSASRSR